MLHDDLMDCCGLGGVSSLNDGQVPESDYPLTLATTIGEQVDGIAALKDEGYKKVLTWLNTNTDNTVTLWAKGPYKLCTNNKRKEGSMATKKSTTKKSKVVRKTTKPLAK